MHGSEALTEADRLMTVCNSCRYCEGICAVFPAMEARRSFADGDLNYLANLCHDCGACYIDCQFAPPHQFDVNVPKVLARVRADSYAAYAWPGAFSVLFRRNGLAVALVAAACVAAFILGVVASRDPRAVFAGGAGAGAFYRVMPHGAMAGLFAAAFGYALLALVLGVRKFCNDIGAPPATAAPLAAFWRAVRDAATLRYLDGGGEGCYAAGDRLDDDRRLFHHLTAYGFLLCFAATVVGTLYHYLLGREAPYPWWDLPVVLGVLGGLGLLIGPAGLLRARARRDPAMGDATPRGLDTTFTTMLLLTSLSGLVLLGLRATPAMGVLLALHLGIVLALFLTLPYGKFVHGLYRFAALVRYAQERNGG
ncbi:MAG: tricarballylate utilization 4Fe-4S protein TcuB [Xanthobacteraceae bacterium]